MCAIAGLILLLISIFAVAGAGLSFGMFIRWVQKRRRYGKMRLRRTAQERLPEGDAHVRLVPRHNVESH